MKAIVPAYCEYPYAHSVQKHGVSKFVLHNFPVPTMFDNDPVGFDFSSHVMYAGHDEIFFGVGHKLQSRTGNNAVENNEKPPMQEPSLFKLNQQVQNEENLCFNGAFINMCELVCNKTVVNDIKQQMALLPKTTKISFKVLRSWLKTSHAGYINNKKE